MEYYPHKRAIVDDATSSSLDECDYTVTSSNAGATLHAQLNEMPMKTCCVKASSKIFSIQMRNSQVCVTKGHICFWKLRNKLIAIYVSTLVSSCIQDVYAMSSLPRGYAVVITMTKGRPGADVDEKNVANLFQQLNFHVKKLKDKTRNVNVLLYSCLTST